ncbi:MAG: TetR/AcrR family transcriptional regulator [Planctomycetes bacterium]|nr:TetR/AcrR family transcriptional regulator [Planctomycetota bacterium]
MVQTKAEAETLRVLEKKRSILDAASKTFREKGFHKTGMRDVAARVGMTVGNLYYYFRNKEDLLAFCQEETLGRLDTLVRRLDAESLPAADRLGRLIVGHVRCLNEGIPGTLAHLEIPGDGGADLRARRDRYEASLRRILREGVAEGSFVPCDEKVAAMAILGSVNWTVRWFRPDGPASADEIGRAFAGQLVRGLLKPELAAGIRPESWSAPIGPGPESTEVTS